MLRVFARFIAVAAFFLLAHAPAMAEKKVALVIGNSAYQHTAPLANPSNDAADVAVALKKLGFRVIEARDLDKSGMDRAVRQFARDLGGADLGAFFYAGHGLQVDGQNFLIPIDAKLEDASGLEFETLRLDAVHKTMERATRTNLIFLDACRDNPLSRNLARALGTRSATIGRGLAVVESGEGTLISFSTQPGNVAQDGAGRNSPYAAALVKHLDTPKDDVSSLLIGVRNDVMRETRRRQVPWEHSALTAKVYLAKLEAPGPTYAQQAELALWGAVKDSRDPAVIQQYLTAYPNGAFAPAARILHDQATVFAMQRQKSAEAERQAAEERLRADRVASQKESDRAKLVERERVEAEKKAAEATRLAQEEEARQAEQARLRRELEARRQQAATEAAERLRQDAERVADAARRTQDEARKLTEAQSRATQSVPAQPGLPALVAAGNAMNSEALARSIQQELKRVGCDPGAVDGKWGARVKAALNEFVKRANAGPVNFEEPTMETLTILKDKSSLICSSVCGVGEVDRNGECVAQSRSIDKSVQSKPSSSLALKLSDCQRKLSTYSKVGAFAGWGAIVAGVSDCGTSWNWKSKEEAIERAFRPCNEKTTGCRIVVIKKPE